MRIHDTQAGYGWLSIGLHWFAAFSIMILWLIGYQMTSEFTRPATYEGLVRVHTSLALMVYVILLYRVLRRLIVGFPGCSPGQQLMLFRISRVVHGTMMLCIVTMLISGPLAVWSGGDVIGFFSLGDIPSPLPPNEAMHNVLTATHATVSKIIFGAFVLHAVGAAKGETSVRMMVATKDAPE